jgi:hypothetical protein
MVDNSKAYGQASQMVGKIIQTTLKGIEQEVSSRAYRASNELRTSALFVLRGSRHGRRYRVPHTGRTYKASAPGEAPAVRTGAFRSSWGQHVHVERNGKRFQCVSAIESNLKAGDSYLGDILENGTSRMKPRPYKQAVIDRALPKIKALYSKPYNLP